MCPWLGANVSRVVSLASPKPRLPDPSCGAHDPDPSITMASSDSATHLGEQPSAAQQLLQKHNDHHATVEDVPDEDLKHDSPAVGDGDGSASAWGPTMSAKAAGKQKAQAPSAAALDTQSTELFPQLGGAKKAAPVVAPVWGAKATNGKTNGSAANAANGNSRATTPGSGATTPARGAPAVSIPGRNVESVLLDPQHVLPRHQLRRPIPDVIKDINRRSRANVSMAQSAGGRMKFEATGPQDVAQQALKELVQQIGAKVRLIYHHPSSLMMGASVFSV